MPPPAPVESTDPTPAPGAARGLSGSRALLAALFLVGLVALTYASMFRVARSPDGSTRLVGNVFALDDAHTITDNPWVRSLANIPRFFRDPATFSTLSTNTDYRPVLQATYALNYAASGYQTWSWNAVNILIHAVVTVCVLLLGRRLFGAAGGRGGGPLAPLPGVTPAQGDAIALCAAVLVAVHPVFSGAVNYVSARSSTLVAALVLPVLLIYLHQLSAARAPAAARGTAWPSTALACGLFALALLTKIEGVALLGVLVVAEVALGPARDRPLWARPWTRGAARRLVPLALVGAAGVVVWSRLSPLQDSITRAGAGMTPGVYLSTQLHAWWYYVGKVFAPVDLMLENLEYPVTRWYYQRSPAGAAPGADAPARLVLGHPEVLTMLAAGAWLLVLLALTRALRRAPGVTLLGLSFFIFLAPHSSIVPLAEMVNEHRPYLALTGVVLLLTVALFYLARWLCAAPVRALLAATLVLALPLALLTQQRNAVWSSDLSLQEDNALKQPAAGRVQMNYGLALQAAGRLDEAEERFRLAVRLLPWYTWARVNLGLLLSRTGRMEEARRQFDEGVAIDERSAGGHLELPWYWRGRFRAQQGDWAGAASDLRRAVEINPGLVRQRAALIEALEAQAAEVEAGEPARARALRDESHAAEAGTAPAQSGDLASERAAFRAQVAPGAGASDLRAAALQDEGLALMARGRHAEAQAKFHAAMAGDPAWVYPRINLAISLGAEGRDAEAEAQFERAQAMAPGNTDVAFYLGRYLAQRGRWEDAIARFADAQRTAPDPTPAQAYLAEALLAAGRAGEAEGVIARVPPGRQREFERLRTEFRQVVKAR